MTSNDFQRTSNDFQRTSKGFPMTSNELPMNLHGILIGSPLEPRKPNCLCFAWFWSSQGRSNEDPMTSNDFRRTSNEPAWDSHWKSIGAQEAKLLMFCMVLEL